MLVYWDVLWLWKLAITSWYTTISFKSRSEEGKSYVRSVRHFAPTWSPEEGRELSRNVMSKKWRGFVYCHFYHQWTDKSWCLLHSCVFSKGTCLKICVAVVMSHSELSSLFYSRPHLYNCFVFLFWLSVHPVVEYDWLFFLVVCQLYMSLWAWSQKFDLQSLVQVSIQYHHLCLVSVVSYSKLYLLQWLWTPTQIAPAKLTA